jgi:hypothetical protein
MPNTQASKAASTAKGGKAKAPKKSDLEAELVQLKGLSYITFK